LYKTYPCRYNNFLELIIYSLDDILITNDEGSKGSIGQQRVAGEKDETAGKTKTLCSPKQLPEGCPEWAASLNDCEVNNW